MRPRGHAVASNLPKRAAPRLVAGRIYGEFCRPLQTAAQDAAWRPINDRCDRKHHGTSRALERALDVHVACDPGISMTPAHTSHIRPADMGIVHARFMDASVHYYVALMSFDNAEIINWYVVDEPKRAATFLAGRCYGHIDEVSAFGKSPLRSPPSRCRLGRW